MLIFNELATPTDDEQHNRAVNAIIERMNRLKIPYDTCLPAARERCESLRQAITKCDYFEQALCNCQSWCNHMNHILNLQISSDIHGLDVPHDYKKAFETGALIPQMDKEFAEYDTLIRELDAFIEQSKNQWSSNDRLRLQHEHAKTQLEELRCKYNEFKQSILFNEKLLKLQQKLNEAENSIDNLTGIQVSFFNFCRKIKNHF